MKEVGESLSDIMVCFRFSLNSSDYHSHDCTLFIQFCLISVLDFKTLICSFLYLASLVIKP